MSGARILDLKTANLQSLSIHFQRHSADRLTESWNSKVKVP